jgi:hypothetical protein
LAAQSNEGNEYRNQGNRQRTHEAGPQLLADQTAAEQTQKNGRNETDPLLRLPWKHEMIISLLSKFVHVVRNLFAICTQLAH